MDILIDTNFFVDSLRFKIPLNQISEVVMEKYNFFTLSVVVDELKKLAAKKSSDGRYAKLSLDVIKSYGMNVLKSAGNADDAIVKISKKKRIVVATNDMALRKSLKAGGTKTIYIKSRKHLGIS